MTAATGTDAAPGLRIDGLLARCHFPPAGTALRCGVSGGADSLTLLVLAVAAGCSVTAVHVDHGVRAGSEAEAALVARAAAEVGASFEAVRLSVGPGPDLEARCRAARHRALGPAAALGHTMDDVAETILLNLVRGAGLRGLGPLQPGPRHPIVRLRRRETTVVCRQVLGLEPFTDPSNRDPRFRRNRVRAELLPLLDAIADRDVTPLLARTARLASEDADLLDALAADLDPKDAAALAAAPRPLAARAIARLLAPAADAERHPPDNATVERVLEVARGATVGTEVGRGWSVRRSAQRLELVAPSGVGGSAG